MKCVTFKHIRCQSSVPFFDSVAQRLNGRRQNMANAWIWIIAPRSEFTWNRRKMFFLFCFFVVDVLVSFCTKILDSKWILRHLPSTWCDAQNCSHAIECRWFRHDRHTICTNTLADRQCCSVSTQPDTQVQSMAYPCNFQLPYAVRTHVSLRFQNLAVLVHRAQFA